MINNVQGCRPFRTLHQAVTNKDKYQTCVFKQQSFTFTHFTDELANSFREQEVKQVVDQK